MNCPRCNATMTPIKRVKCDTGDAQLCQCPRCGARAYEQDTFTPHLFPVEREMLARTQKALVPC